MDITGIAITGVVLALGCGWYLLARWKAQQGAKDEAVHHFLCPGCKRRLSFRARQAGHRGECSRCGQAFVFPPVAQSID